MSTPFGDLVALVHRLRAPGGCPWDREQTHETLRPFLLEEAYEVLEAIENRNPEALRDELGDLLLQVVLHAELAAEEGRFTIDDVIAGLSAKMTRRHPHVFGDVAAADADEVVRNWSRIKAAERAGSDADADRSVLAGLPAELPALHAAYRTGEKASRVGFDWPSARAVLTKVREELDELERAVDAGERDAVEHELGDLLFALASFGRLAEAHPEMALRAALARFGRRFRWMEAALRDRGRDVHAVGGDELEALWQEAKAAVG
jgi:tetrapyrrole methylase family protein / MazG family protein